MEISRAAHLHLMLLQVPCRVHEQLSCKGELIEKVVEATKYARAAAEEDGFMNPDLIAGPLQVDAAVDPLVAAVKAKDSPVAGNANVLVFPDLNSGNSGYKAVQQASKSRCWSNFARLTKAGQ